MKPAAESRPSFSGALKPRRLAAPPARSGFDPRFAEKGLNEASSLQSCFAPPGRQGANRVGSRQGDAHPAQVDRETEADLSSAKAQHDPAGVAELRDAPASRHRQAGPDGRVEAHDVAWLMKVRRRSDQIRRRSADQGARAYPADRQWIIASFESQYSAAAGDAEDET